jgi:tripartite-type tricarboxylate transporter receptor subunit TctC
MMIDIPASSLPQLREGRIKAYAITAPARLVSAPEIPTVDEAGLPGLYVSVWYALWAPKATPTDIVAKLNAALVEALAEPAVSQRFTELGLDIPPRIQQTPDFLADHHRAEIEKWWPIIKAAGIRAQ